MIKGHILPPSFKITNEKIVQRHMNACCLAEFFRLYPDIFSSVEGFVLSEYYGEFRKFINERQDSLMHILYESIPAELHSKIDKWLNELSSENGNLYDAYVQTINDIDQLEKYSDELKKSGTPQELRMAANVQNAINTIKDTDILSFLSRKSILPKYGFPVDSVELFTSPASYSFQNTSKLRLSRDLAIAIAEYAPDSEVIADRKLYKSRYIKMPPKKNHALIEKYFAICTNSECGCVNTALSRTDLQYQCKICGSDVELMGNYIVPQYGFVSELRSKKATMKKPDRTYRGDVHYIGNSSGDTEEFKIGEITVTVTKTKDDELLIMNRTPFHMCKSCGFTVRNNGGLNELSQYKKEQHRSSEGRVCTNKLFDKVYNPDVSAYAPTFGSDAAKLSLVLDSKTAARLYVKGDDTGTESTINATKADYPSYHEVAGLLPQNLADEQTITVGGTDYKFSALSWCNRVLTNGSASQKNVNMAKAIMAYYEAAKNYTAPANPYAAAKVGDVVSFGSYDWYVINKRDDGVTLLMKESFTNKAYNDSITDVTWETCTLRTYLNGDFYNTFSAEDKAKIVKNSNTNPNNPTYGTNGGNNTEDYIYLLSIDEANALDNSIKAIGSDWWLRLPGNVSNKAAYVYVTGRILASGHFVNNAYGVRPVLNLKF